MCAAAVIILALSGFAAVPKYEVRIENVSEHKLIHALAAKPGNNLWLVHVNSVEKLPVAEWYEIGDAYQFIFSEVIYQAPYVGYLNDQNAEIIAPGTLRISEFNTPMDSISFFAGDISKHMMFWNGKWLPLYEGAGGGDLIRITIEKVSAFTLLSTKRN